MTVQNNTEPVSAAAHTVNGEWAEAQRINDLPQVDEAIRGVIADPTGDNATILVREVMRAFILTATEGAAGTLAQISQLLTHNGNAPASPADIVKRVAACVRTVRDFGVIIHDMTVANQAAWIDWKHGGGAEAGMQWIENGLSGPGMIPGDDDGDCEDDGSPLDPLLKDAQAFFDRHSSWAMKGDPDNTIANKLIATKNDRELLTLVEANRLGFYFAVSASHPQGFECLVLGNGQGMDIIGRAPTAREALRAAARALDPQADLFADATTA